MPDNDDEKEGLHRTSMQRKRVNPKTLVLARRIKRLMELKGWIQSDLARHADIDRRTISTLLLGKTWPVHENLLKIAQAFNVPISDLSADVDSPFADANQESKAFSAEQVPGRPGYMFVQMHRVVRWKTAVAIQNLVLAEIEAEGDDASVG